MEVVILGIGNYAEVMIELCEELELSIYNLYHFNSTRNGENIGDYTIAGSYQDFIDLDNKNLDVVVAIGDNLIRETWLNKMRNLGYNTPTLIHPSAYISKSAQIGNAVYIHPRAFVWSRSVVSNSVIISPNATISHHAKVGSGCLISANSVVGSYVTLGERILVGINAGIISKKISIGSDSIIGGNAMVLENFPKNSVIIGTPGKILK